MGLDGNRETQRCRIRRGRAGESGGAGRGRPARPRACRCSPAAGRRRCGRRPRAWPGRARTRRRGGGCPWCARRARGRARRRWRRARRAGRRPTAGRRGPRAWRTRARRWPRSGAAAARACGADSRACASSDGAGQLLVGPLDERMAGGDAHSIQYRMLGATSLAAVDSDSAVRANRRQKNAHANAMCGRRVRRSWLGATNEAQTGGGGGVASGCCVVLFVVFVTLARSFLVHWPVQGWRAQARRAAQRPARQGLAVHRQRRHVARQVASQAQVWCCA